MTSTAKGTVRLGDRLVRRLGFGALRLLDADAFSPPPDPEAAHVVLQHAASVVDVIDTADCYGNGVSESLIAETLHPYRDGLVIATKGGQTCHEPGAWRPSAAPDRLKRCCEASLRRLRLDRIDLYQLHCVDPAVGLEASVMALAELREEGLIRHVGLCNVTAEQLRQAQQIVPIVAIQNRYNLFDRHSDQLIDTCERQGIAFLPWFPLRRGALAATHGNSLAKVADSLGATPAQIALAWLLYRSPVLLPIPGTGSLSHLRELTGSLSIEIDEETLYRLDGISGLGPAASPSYEVGGSRSD